MKEQGQEGDHEHQEDTDDAVFDPSKDGNEVVATRLVSKELSAIGVPADWNLLVQSTQEDHYKNTVSLDQRPKIPLLTSNNENLNR